VPSANAKEVVTIELIGIVPGMETP